MNSTDNIINFNIEDQKEKIFLSKNSDKYILLDTSDFNAPVRMDYGMRKLEEHFKAEAEKHNISIDNLNLNSVSMATGDIDMDIATLTQADEFVRDVLNDIFDYDVCSVVFGRANTLSVDKNGECYYEKFLNAVLPLYEKVYKTRIKKLSSRAEIYAKAKGKYSK